MLVIYGMKKLLDVCRCWLCFKAHAVTEVSAIRMKMVKGCNILDCTPLECLSVLSKSQLDLGLKFQYPILVKRVPKSLLLKYTICLTQILPYGLLSSDGLILTIWANLKNSLSYAN